MKYPKRHILLFLIIWSAFRPDASLAQPYGNEWIRFDQVYYKIPVAKDGMYRLTYDDLASAGFPVTGVNPARIQIFHRGTEQAIYIEGQSDGRFDPGDFIEFYGLRNDGTLDTELYRTPEAQPHRYINIFSDTTVYFLTWSSVSDGLRMAFFQEDNTSGLPAEPYQLEENINLYTGNYAAGLHYPVGAASAETILTTFDYGEGWTSGRIRKGKYRDFILTGLSAREVSGPPPALEVLLAGRNNLNHKVSFFAGPGVGTLRKLGEVTFSSYYNKSFADTLMWSDVSSDGSLVVRVQVDGIGTASDFASVSYIRLRFASAMQMAGATEKVFWLRPASSGKSYVEIADVPSGAKLYDITDPSRPLRIGFNLSSGTLSAIIPNTFSGKKLLVSSTPTAHAPAKITGMRKINPARPKFIIISNEYLRRPTNSYNDPVKAYGAYRASVAGGGFDTLVVNIGTLYNEFSYGEVTPLAIYRFVRYLVQKGKPEYLLIMGKGLTPNYDAHRKDFQTLQFKDLVPPAGHPGTDLTFSTGLSASGYIPVLPTGRVAAGEPADVEAYLNKIKESESVSYDKLWKKNLIHLSGGRNAWEQNLFYNYVESYRAIAEGPFLGGDVVTETKKTTDATELINISDYVNAGLLQITFFGHSGTFGSDIEIGYVSNPGMAYNNKGKYPTILVNGCNAGDAYLPVRGFGEDWIITPDLGAVAFIAHSSIGFPPKLNKYTSSYYRTAFADTAYINRGIGDILTRTAERYQEAVPSMSEADMAQIEQMALQGDPALINFAARLPDYATEGDKVYASSKDGTPITAETEVFDLNIITSNFGKAITDSLRVSVTRKLSNGTEIHLDTIIFPPVFYLDTLIVEIKGIGKEGFGNNTFTITLDPLNEIPEMDEGNNNAVYQMFVSLGGTTCLFPAPFAIEKDKKVGLIAQALDLLQGERSFLIELDTTDQFNSPVRQMVTLTGRTWVKWQVELFQNFPEKDSTVFYWRSKFVNPRPDELDIWSNSSFTYIKDSPPGWSMSHFQQFKDVKSNDIIPDQQQREWQFKTFETKVYVRTYGANNPDFGYQNVELELNDMPFIFETRLCTDNSINLMAMDKSTTLPYLVLNFSPNPILDRRSCGRVPQVINNFIEGEIENQNRVEQYIDAVHDGDYVMVFSIGSLAYGDWPAATLAKLGEIGVSPETMGRLQTGYPVIILGKKGSAPGTAIEILPDFTDSIPPEAQELVLYEEVKGTLDKGVMESPVAGPAKSWLDFSREIGHLNDPPQDHYSFDIIGIATDQTEQVLFENVTSRTVDLSGVNSLRFPFIKMKMRSENPDALVPTQLRRWTLRFELEPEGIIRLADGQQSEGIEKQEGDTVQVNMRFDNISNVDFSDSIQVNFTLYNKDLAKSYADSMKIAALKGGEGSDIRLVLQTLDKGGENDLKVFANPYILPEGNYNNNLLNMKDFLHVSMDNENPILEVTVDGGFIMDGDIVSPTPLITLRMKDENTVRLKQDTTGIDLYIKKPCDGCTFERISYSWPNVVWSPATPSSDFTMEYQPDRLQDGIYTIKAQAVDASGNVSGTEPYTISFEVINESQITNFYPYPNPFSTSTRFVFTLTGSEIPDDLIIQIMTVTGKVVREITRDEIGPIKIGNNITEYAWDGRDEFGDQLANGVYLYRVKVKMNGEEIPLRPTAADRAFKNGFGKLYILR